jgi:hypothetical protein
MSLATARFDPRAFSPSLYYEPGLKVQNEPGLMGSGVVWPKKRWGPGHLSRHPFSTNARRSFRSKSGMVVGMEVHPTVAQPLDGPLQRPQLPTRRSRACRPDGQEGAGEEGGHCLAAVMGLYKL